MIYDLQDLNNNKRWMNGSSQQFCHPNHQQATKNGRIYLPCEQKQDCDLCLVSVTVERMDLNKIRQRKLLKLNRAK